LKYSIGGLDSFVNTLIVRRNAMSESNSPETSNEPAASNEIALSSRQVIDIAIRLAVGLVFVVVSYQILAPFVGLIVWGGVIAIAVYPLFSKLVDRLGGRRKIAVSLFVLIGIAIILVPVLAMSSSLFESAQDLGEQVEQGTFHIPPPPPKVKDWPMVGTQVNEFWSKASNNLQAFADEYGPQMKNLVGQVVTTLAGASAGVLTFLISIVIAGMFLAGSETCIRGMNAFSCRLFGEERGKEFNDLSAKTVRSVATGVLGVAFIQAALAGIGMAVAGVPWVGMWALLVMLLAIMQLPPIIILLPIALWVFGSADSQLMAWGFLIWAILVALSDTVLKPMLLGRGVDVPMIVVLLGAIGGMILGGIIGLFVGAVVLALAYRLLMEWLNEGSEAPA
jgi:predicted PurR-regulated permease PerM